MQYGYFAAPTTKKLTDSGRVVRGGGWTGYTHLAGRDGPLCGEQAGAGLVWHQYEGRGERVQCQKCVTIFNAQQEAAREAIRQEKRASASQSQSRTSGGTGSSSAGASRRGTRSKGKAAQQAAQAPASAPMPSAPLPVPQVLDLVPPAPVASVGTSASTSTSASANTGAGDYIEPDVYAICDLSTYGAPHPYNTMELLELLETLMGQGLSPDTSVTTSDSGGNAYAACLDMVGSAGVVTLKPHPWIHQREAEALARDGAMVAGQPFDVNRRALTVGELAAKLRAVSRRGPCAIIVQMDAEGNGSSTLLSVMVNVTRGFLRYDRDPSILPDWPHISDPFIALMSGV